MCSSLPGSDRSHFRHVAAVTSSRGCKAKSALLPQQQIDEHCDGQEGAADRRVTAQEEEEVAEETEEDHPDHVKLKEQVENVESSRHSAQVLHEGRESWHGEETHTGVRSFMELRSRKRMQNDGELTQHPEEPTQQADEQQLPHLLQALLSRGQQAAVAQLLEELLTAEPSHHKEKQSQPWRNREAPRTIRL